MIFNRSVNPYLAFDDRLLILFGTPIMAVLNQVLFFGKTFEDLGSESMIWFVESCLFVFVFWMFNRQVIITLRKKYNSFESSKKRFLYQAGIVVIAIPIIGTIVTIGLKYVYGILGLTKGEDPTFLQSNLATYFITFAIMMLYDTIYYLAKYEEAILEKNKIQVLNVQNELRNLRNQINPHFLFNSLNTLMNLIHTDTDRASSYLSKLSKFYRNTVSTQKEQCIPFEEELANTQIYIDLLHERFYNALTVELDIPPRTHGKILTLSLQLLIENAIKHNIVSQAKPLRVKIAVRDAYVIVSNNIQLKIEEVSSTGIGLNNIKERMKFFTDQPVLIDEDEKQFTVSIPLIK